jgi:hypothetical protein
VILISRATASSIGRGEPTRKIALKVFGSSGWDKDAFCSRAWICRLTDQLHKLPGRGAEFQYAERAP